MKYQIEMSTKFKKGYKLAIKRGYNDILLKEVISILASGEELPSKYKDHTLIGDSKGYRECHITPVLLFLSRFVALCH